MARRRRRSLNCFATNGSSSEAAAFGAPVEAGVVVDAAAEDEAGEDEEATVDSSALVEAFFELSPLQPAATITRRATLRGRMGSRWAVGVPDHAAGNGWARRALGGCTLTGGYGHRIAGEGRFCFESVTSREDDPAPQACDQPGMQLQDGTWGARDP